MKAMALNDARAVWQAILAVDPDSLAPVTDQRVHLDEFAALLRPALKELGFSNRKIGVRVPNYSMAQALDIEIPWADARAESGENALEIYDERREVKNHLSDIVLALFPKNGSRSDVFSDYFDYTFSID